MSTHQHETTDQNPLTPDLTQNPWTAQNPLTTRVLEWPTTTTPLVTDAGFETWAVFHHGVDLPAFAAYPLLDTDAGRDLLLDYYERFTAIARSVGAGVLLETPTWRANPDWAAVLGYDLGELARLIGASTALLDEVRAEWRGTEPFIVSGTVGPRGDGYRVEATMSVEEAAAYHSWQITRMAETGVDLVTALTVGYVEEAVGIVRAARDHGLPVVISFTVETDGRLPSGATLAEAITRTDAATDAPPLHYMVNCAHPTHFDGVLEPGSDWVVRIGGLRANASTLSHAELDEMVELDDGDPRDLAERYVGLRTALPALQVVGGCCGTDDRHVAAIAAAMFGGRGSGTRSAAVA